VGFTRDKRASREHIAIGSEERLGDLVGSSAKTRLLFRQLREAAPTDLFILIPLRGRQGPARSSSPSTSTKTASAQPVRSSS
jgi:hypothetical protein